MLGERADRDIVDTGFGQAPQILEGDIAGDLQPRPAVVQRDGLFEIVRREVVEQYPARAGFECLEELTRRLHLDLDILIRKSIIGLLQHQRDRTCCAYMILLDQDRIVEADAMVVSTAAQHGVFLCQTQAGQCLAGIKYAYARSLYSLYVTADQSGGS